MLEVGNFQGPLNMTESRSHFSAWAVVSSPLVLGFDLTNSAMVDELWPIISNPEVHAVNQAWAGHPGRQVASTDTYQVRTAAASLSYPRTSNLCGFMWVFLSAYSFEVQPPETVMAIVRLEFRKSLVISAPFS